MTAQVLDTIKYQKENYSLCNSPEAVLFKPQDYGLEPYSFSTACWRGYICRYKIEDTQLLLEELRIGFDEEESLKAKRGEGKELFGKFPKPSGDDFAYETLDMPIIFTGSLLLCKDFIPELYFHGAFHPTWKYEKVLELSLVRGKITRVADKSEQISGERNKQL